MITEARKRANANYEKTHRHPCADCGKPISRKGTRCKHCASSGKRHPFYGLKGEKHPAWKGKRHQLKSGYVLVYNPSHPRKMSKGGYVFEHILIWEQTHRKPLPQGWIVHHLNGIKNDNRPSNLVALSNKKHSLVLQAKAKRIQELEALLNNQHQLL